MSSFVLKIIACIAMFLDHLGYVVFGSSSFFNCLGRFAFPIFAFQLTEGYVHTKNLKEYFIRLLLFACLSQIPFMLFLSTFTTNITINIFFELILGLLFMTIYDKCNKVLGVIIGIIYMITAEKLHFDYGWYGICIIMIFHIFKNRKVPMSCAFILTTLLKYLLPIITLDIRDIFNILFSLKRYSQFFLFTCLTIVFILFYNNIKGQNIKYFLYIFYPTHLLILYFLNFII